MKSSMLFSQNSARVKSNAGRENQTSPRGTRMYQCAHVKARPRAKQGHEQANTTQDVVRRTHTTDIYKVKTSDTIIHRRK